MDEDMTTTATSTTGESYEDEGWLGADDIISSLPSFTLPSQLESLGGGSSSHHNNDDISRVTEDSASIFSGATSLFMNELIDGDPEIYALQQKIQQTRRDFKTLKYRTGKEARKQRQKELHALQSDKNAKARQVWFTLEKNKKNPLGLGEYKDELMKITLPSHDLSPNALHMEARLLRANHNLQMGTKQAELAQQSQQDIIEYLYSTVKPDAERQIPLVKKEGETKVEQAKASKDEMVRLFEKCLDLQGKILTKYRLQYKDDYHSSDDDDDLSQIGDNDERSHQSAKAKREAWAKARVGVWEQKRQQRQQVEKGKDGENEDGEDLGTQSTEAQPLETADKNLTPRRSLSPKSSREGVAKRIAANRARRAATSTTTTTDSSHTRRSPDAKPTTPTTTRPLTPKKDSPASPSSPKALRRRELSERERLARERLAQRQDPLSSSTRSELSERERVARERLAQRQDSLSSSTRSMNSSTRSTRSLGGSTRSVSSHTRSTARPGLSSRAASVAKISAESRQERTGAASRPGLSSRAASVAKISSESREERLKNLRSRNSPPRGSVTGARGGLSEERRAQLRSSSRRLGGKPTSAGVTAAAPKTSG